MSTQSYFSISGFRLPYSLGGGSESELLEEEEEEEEAEEELEEGSLREVLCNLAVIARAALEIGR